MLLPSLSEVRIVASLRLAFALSSRVLGCARLPPCSRRSVCAYILYACRHSTRGHSLQPIVASLLPALLLPRYVFALSIRSIHFVHSRSVRISRLQDTWFADSLRSYAQPPIASLISSASHIYISIVHSLLIVASFLSSCIFSRTDPPKLQSFRLRLLSLTFSGSSLCQRRPSPIVNVSSLRSSTSPIFDNRQSDLEALRPSRISDTPHG